MRKLAMGRYFVAADLIFAGLMIVVLAGVGCGGNSASSTPTPSPVPPSVASFQPTSGSAGASVTIMGASLNGATTVTFNGMAAVFTVNSGSQITATVPNGANTGKISIITPGGTSNSTNDFIVTAPTPTITNFAPTSGPTGTAVSISGTNLTGATAVTFNGIAATFVLSSGQITATVPGTATTGKISVTTPVGTATSTSNFTVATSVVPTVTSFSPTTGAVGATVTIAGTNLTGATAVKFNGTIASFVVNSSTQITATVLTGATTGKISVTTPGGTATSASNFTVTVVAALTITVSPLTATLLPNGTQQFTATVTNATNPAVTWSATGGTISTSGLYTAGTTAGSFAAKATSVQDPTKSASATIGIVTSNAGAHPRIILDVPTLSTLRARAQAKTAEWTALKSVCDSFTGGGTVNFPGENGYPNLPSVGEGYQGDGYVGALMPLGLCYHSTILSDPTTAAKYGTKAVAVLMAMSDPGHTIINGNPIWDRDNGYGVRNYVFGMGIGYDWFHDLMTPAQQAQLQTSLSNWLHGFENDSADNFEYDHPQGNYFAGYYAGKCMAALAVEGDSPLGTTWWNDWYNNQHLGRVVPYYAANMGGGGWPEGFAAYGPLASRNMALTTLAVRTAKGLDLIHATQAYSFPLNQAQWLMHFTWPSRDFIDDRDTVHSGNSDTIWPGTGDPNTYSFFAGFLQMWNDPLAPTMHKYARDAKAVLAHEGAGTADEWIEFLFWDDTAPETADYSAAGLSHLAPGIGEVSARADWTTNSAWMSFRSGPYVNNPGAGHQGFDAGSLALVRGKNPLLVNPGGWFAHNPNGNAGETMVFNDWFGNWDADHTAEDRTLFNNFQVRHVSGQSVLDQYGQWAMQRTDGARTQISRFEDGGAYVLAVGQFLEDMYRPFKTICANKSPITSWSRQVVYLRPSQFVVFDRTAICDASLDQYLAFHFAANPVEVTAPAAGLHRFDVNTGTFAGSMTTVLPANAATITTDHLSTDTTTWSKVWRMEVRASDAATATRRWMTVFDLASSSSQVASATGVNVSSGAAVGALLQSSSGNGVVISGTAPVGTAITGTLSYVVPAAQTRHVITDLAPSTGYTISVSSAGGNHSVSIVQGGSSTTSANGVLTFQVSASGQVTQ